MSIKDDDYRKKEVEREFYKNIKKQKEERMNKFNQKFEEYSKNKPIKCLSDKGLLYLKFGIDKLKNFHGDNLILTNSQDMEVSEFEDFCIGFYNENIRGNMEFTNKSMISIAASVLYTCCLMKGICVTQKDIAEIYYITEVTVRNNHKLIREVLRI